MWRLIGRAARRLWQDAAPTSGPVAEPSPADEPPGASPSVAPVSASPTGSGRADPLRAVGLDWRDVWRIAAALALALALAVLLLATLAVLFRPLLLLFLAVVLATTLEPLVARLERRMRRSFAVVLVFLVLLAVLVGAGWLIVPPIVEQARVVVEDAPGLVERAQGTLDRFGADQAQIGDRLRSAVGGFGGVLASLPLRVVSAATELLLVVAMAVYWLIAAPALRRFALSLVPPARRAEASEVLREVGRTMGGYFRGAMLDGLIMGALVYVGLRLLGSDYALVLALLVVIGELVPIVGPIAASVPAIAVALLDSPAQALKVGIFYLVIQQIESNLVEPNIMSKQTEMPPLLVLFALLAGGAVAGILGAVVAIPLAGALRVLVIRVIAPAVRQWSGAAVGNRQ